MGKTQNQGQAGEQLAADFLTRQGLQLLERNFRCRGGEVDLICRDGRTTVFVEVRLRGSERFGGAAASITGAKQQRVILAARHWLAGKPEQACRFDAVLLERLDMAAISWIKGAFDAD